MGHIKRHPLSDSKVVAPEPDVLSTADKMIAPIIEQVMQRRVESRISTESVVEEAALAWLESVGWSVRHRLEIAPGESKAERYIGRAV